MMTITYPVKNGLYINLTNRCPCACTFCLRQNDDSVYGSQPLWLDREPTVDREALDAVGIPYHTKFATPLGRVGGRNRGSIFQEPDSAHDYKIYVHKDDYDRAVAAIQPALRNWNN